MRRRNFASCAGAVLALLLWVTGAAADFDHEYTHQLGLALINDSASWQRACQYLRIAARGMPGKGPSIFAQIA